METSRSTLYRNFLFAGIPILLIVGFASGLRSLYPFAAALSLVGFAAYLVSLRAGRGLEAERKIYPSAFEGDDVPVTVTLISRERTAYLVEIADRFGPGIVDTQLMLEPGPVPPGRSRSIVYQGFCSRHWGLYNVGPIELTTCDPLGLYHITRSMPLVEEFAVFPRVYDVAGLERLGSTASLLPQDATAGQPGQSLQYLGVRDYRPGDDLRKIHWPATARRATPIVKEYEVDLIPYFTLFLDLARANRGGTGKKSTMEYVVRTGASLLWSAVRRGHIVQVFGEGSKPFFVPPGSGEIHLTLALHELIHAQQDGSEELMAVVERNRTHLPPGSTAALLFGTVIVEQSAVADFLEFCGARGVRPMFLFTNNFTFPAWERWSISRAEVSERVQELSYFLRSRRIPGAILTADDDLETALARPDLFWESL